MPTFRDIWVFILIIFLSGICSCGKSQQPDNLTYAETIMENCPDSALYYLSRVTLPEDASEDTKALYALLLTQARYKNYIDETNDSLIQTAETYFIQKNDAEHAILSMYLRGVIQKNSGKLGEAAVSMQRGMEWAHENSLHKMEALCAKGLFNIHVNLFDGSGQVRYAKRSYDAFKKGNCNDWIGYAGLNLATAYNNNGNYTQAIKQSQENLRLGIYNKDTTLLAAANRSLAISLIAINRYRDALSAYGNAYLLNHDVLTKFDRDNIVLALFKIPKDSINQEIDLLSKNLPLPNEDNLPFEILASQGNYKEAYMGLAAYKEEQDSVLLCILRNNITDMLKSHEDNRQTLLIEKNKRDRLIAILSIVVVLVISLVIILSLRLHLQAKKKQQEAIIKNAESLKEDLAHQMKINASLSDSNNELTASNNELTVSNKELTVSNKELTVSNKELTSHNDRLSEDNKELRASNQQLTSHNERLSKDNKELRASNQQLTSHTHNLSDTNNKLTEANSKLSTFNVKLHHSNNELKESNNQLSASIVKTFQEKYSIVDSLCSAYYEAKNTASEKKRIISEVEQIIKDFAEMSSLMSDHIERKDLHIGSLLSSFKKDFPGLKIEDYRLFLYLMMDFSSRSIALLLNEKIEVIYNRKSRLKIKIKNSTVARKEDYLRAIHLIS